MTPSDWAGVIKKIAPKADPRFIASFADAAGARFSEWDVREASAVAGFLGHAAHETGGFKSFTENMNYSAARICAVWPSRFKTVAAAQPYVGNPQKLANNVYANRMGNGPEASGDGWRNRGGGMFQHTGATEYARVKRRTGYTAAEVRDPARAGAMLAAGLTYVIDRGMLPALRSGNISASTKLLNGGQIGLTDRRIMIARADAAMAGRSVPAARTTIERRDRAQGQAAAAATTSGGAGVAGTVADGAASAPAAAPSNAFLFMGLGLAAALLGVAIWRFAVSQREQGTLDDEARQRDAALDAIPV